MPTIPYKKVSEAEGITRQVYEVIMKTYGVREPHGVYMLMGHTPDFLKASWGRSVMLYGRDTKFTLKEKHLVTLAVSATNNCEYCTRIHTERLRQLGTTFEELVETMMVVDLTNGYDKFVIGTQADTDSPTLPFLEAQKAEPAARETLERIQKAYDAGKAEVVFSLMGYLPRYLEASWRRSVLCFKEEGRLGLRMKHAIAFAVAATNSCDYYVRVHAGRLRDLGLTDEELTELLLIVDLTCGYNRYVQGLQADLESSPFGEDAEANKAASCVGKRGPSCCG